MKLAVIVASWAWLVATVAILAWLASIWIRAPGSLGHQMDSGAFLNAANTWPDLYSGHPNNFLSLPAVALVALPFLHVPLSWEPLVWRLALVAALVAAWKLTELTQSPRTWLLVLLGNPITFTTVMLGQVTPFLVLALAGAAWFWRRGRAVEAGVVLALGSQMKPTLFIAVPLALLAANQARLLLGLVAGGLAIGIVYTLLMGPAWLPDFLNATVSRHDNLVDAEGNTVAALGFLAWPLRIAALALVPLTAWRQGPDVAVAVALAGSLVLTPYLHREDMLVVFTIAWLLMRSRGHRVGEWVGASGVVAATVFVPALMVAWEFGVILVAGRRWRQQPAPNPA